MFICIEIHYKYWLVKINPKFGNWWFTLFPPKCVRKGYLFRLRSDHQQIFRLHINVHNEFPTLDSLYTAGQKAQKMDFYFQLVVIIEVNKSLDATWVMNDEKSYSTIRSFSEQVQHNNTTARKMENELQTNVWFHSTCRWPRISCAVSLPQPDVNQLLLLNQCRSQDNYADWCVLKEKEKIHRPFIGLCGFYWPFSALFRDFLTCC